LPEVRLFGFGGDRMEAAGMELCENLAQRLPIIGITQVLANLGAIRELFRRAEDLMDLRKPDLLILVDYPGFNLRLARKAARRGIKVIYYISPQLWAWHRSRIKIIRQCVSHMLVILPFEKKMYDEENIPATYVGHPLMDDTDTLSHKEEVRARLKLDPGRLVVGLLPGSRTGEIHRHMPLLLESCRLIQQAIPEVQWLLPRAGTVSADVLQVYLERYDDVKVTVAETDLKCVRAIMDFAICKSGTSTLELALLRVPMVIFYRASAITAFIARRVIKVPFIGLVNIIAGREVAPELLQEDAVPKQIAARVTQLLKNPDMLASMRQDLDDVAKTLGGPGASKRAAQEIAEAVK
jgi:lipid-A-disaccharide synthase